MLVDLARGAHLREIAHPPQQSQRDPRRAPASRGDRRQRRIRHPRHVQFDRGALEDRQQFLFGVELQVVGDAEAAAQRAGEQSRASRRADQRKRLQMVGDHLGVHA